MPKIEVDLDELLGSYDDEGPGSFRNLVEQRAAQMLLEQTGGDARRAVQSITNDVVREAVAAHVAAALAQPIQRTTTWGERRGEAVTVLELIRQELESYLNGVTPTGARRDAYSTDRTPTNLAQLIGQEATTALNRELAKTVQEAKARVHEHITQAALEAAVKTLSGKVH